MPASESVNGIILTTSALSRMSTRSYLFFSIRTDQAALIEGARALIAREGLSSDEAIVPGVDGGKELLFLLTPSDVSLFSEAVDAEGGELMDVFDAWLGGPANTAIPDDVIIPEGRLPGVAERLADWAEFCSDPERNFPLLNGALVNLVTCEKLPVTMDFPNAAYKVDGDFSSWKQADVFFD